MGQIRKKEAFGIIKGSLTDEEEEPISYCEENGIRSIRGARVYMSGEVYGKVDSEGWKQCHECGLIVPVFELKRESRLKDIIEPTNNPFDQGKNIVGLDNKNRKKQNKFEKLRKEIEKEKIRISNKN
jgi:hypothetical protein